MIRIYSSSRAERIIRKHSPWIRTVAARYKMPASVIQAILFQEMTQIDLWDLAADTAVRLGIFGKNDSSTGYAQIFGWVGVNAANFAVDLGLTDYDSLGIPSGHRLDPDDPADVRMVWKRLHGSRKANIEFAALNLLCAAREMTGRIDFASYDEEEMKLILTRYNADTRHVTPYGEAAYRNYVRYSEHA